MIKFKEFNRKWRPIVREAVERMEKEGLLNIEEKDIRKLHYATVSTNEEEIVYCNAMSKDINLYEIDRISLLATEACIRRMLKDKIKDILITLTKEKNICYTDTEFNTLLELLVETAIVAMNPTAGPIFQVKVKDYYINVYPKYVNIRFPIKGKSTKNPIDNKVLASHLLGEFRRRMRLKDKWVSMNYELYKDYSSKGLIKEVNLEKRLNLLKEKTELVARFEMNIKEFIKLFTIIPKEDIDKMSVYELAFIKNNLMQLSFVWRLVENNENISLDRHIPPYFKVSIKFK